MENKLQVFMNNYNCLEKFFIPKLIVESGCNLLLIL